jgi:rubredoxin
MMTMIDCSMCGHSFTRQEGAACQGGCPMASGCGMVTCPSCGYEFPPESKLVTLVSNLLRRSLPERKSASRVEAHRVSAVPAQGSR